MIVTSESPTLPKFVAIHGAPRSGTSWLGQIFNSSEHVAYRYQPLFSYEFRGAIDANSDRAAIQRFMRALLVTQDDFVLQRRSASLSGYTLEFAKSAITHLVYKEVRYHEVLENLLSKWPRAIVIGLIRNPCAVIHSWSKAPREFNPRWDLLEQWRSASLKNDADAGNCYGFDRWRRLAETFLELERSYPGRFVIARYEALDANPASEVARIFRACGLQVSEQVSAFVAKSRSCDDGSAYGVLRDRSHDAKAWQRELDSRIVRAIFAELQGTALEGFLSDLA
jgi:hypothetical protein